MDCVLKFTSGHTGRHHDIQELFLSTFTESEGAAEGRVIGSFVDEMMNKTDSDDLLVYCAYDGAPLVGCIFFSRLIYEQDERTVFILSPVAVKTARQGQGIGQQLISFGLNALRAKEVDIVLTYGDPIYYAKTGFQQISEEVAKAPLKLSQPKGWQAQSLTSTIIAPLMGPARCVEALNKSELW